MKPLTQAFCAVRGDDAGVHVRHNRSRRTLCKRTMSHDLDPAALAIKDVCEVCRERMDKRLYTRVQRR